MKRMLPLFLLMLLGCASHHPPIVGLPDHPHYDCALGEDCSRYPTPHYSNVQCGLGGQNDSCGIGIVPAQLTPTGCLLHRIVTLGHVAQECRRKK